MIVLIAGYIYIKRLKTAKRKKKKQIALLHRLMISSHWIKSPATLSPSQLLVAAFWAVNWPVHSAGNVSVVVLLCV